MIRFFLLVYLLTSSTCSELLSRHRRAWIISSFIIEEEHPGPFPYVLGNVKSVQDYGVIFQLFGEGVDEEPKGVLSIDKDTGTVYVHKPLDYEERKILKLKFQSIKTKDKSVDTLLGVEITILDINDNPPRFQRDLYEISIHEQDTQGSNLLRVVAFDGDQRGTPNATFHYEIQSVSPNAANTEFFINEFGSISFKGCLDREVAERFTVLVEAKDHGEVVSLSSSTTVIIHVQDGNNHLPTISGQTGSGKVKEYETGTSPLRLHVTDKDRPNSPAWRARYTIQGDKGGHYHIETDPETNDGFLTVVKSLDFEEGAQRELKILVENEAPYFSCEVIEKTSSGLWKVDAKGAAQPHSVTVFIEVEDTNDPPIFTETVKDALLVENAPIGTWVEKVTAVDPDSSHASDFVYKIGSDPAGWVTVDPQTGDIKTVKIPDRESPHVNGVYTVVLHAVDYGNPPLTGTATLNIYLSDQNDNVPHLTVDHVDVCVSDGPTTTNITAFDPDENPFGGPFTFELLGDVERKWKLEPSYGYTAGLVKAPNVHAGPHTIHLKIYDLQRKSGINNLSVTVCDCSVAPNCQGRRTPKASGDLAFGAVAVTSLLLILLLLLMSVSISCKTKFASLQGVDVSGETLLKFNIEKPGTDCKLIDIVQAVSTDEVDHDPSDWHNLTDAEQLRKNMEQNYIHTFSGECRMKNVSYQTSANWNQATWKTTNGFQHNHQTSDMSTKNFHYKRNSSYAPPAALLTLLRQTLSSVQERERDLQDCKPHVYADEGEWDKVLELESIIHDDQSIQEALNDLGPQFNRLASICKQPHI